MQKNHLLAIILFFVSFSYSSISWGRTENDFTASSLTSLSFYSLSNRLYEELNLEELGMSRSTLDFAVMGYENLLNKGVVKNSQYLTVVDFSQPLYSRRFYLLDVENMELVENTYVMHGKNSGFEMAERFSNSMNSYQSSLGFYLTKNTYRGSRGYSLRLSGLERGINHNAEARGIVLHGSVYINESRVQQRRVERSLGCPAIPMEENAKVINMVKNGSVLFIYHPTETYLQRSSVLSWTPDSDMASAAY